MLIRAKWYEETLAKDTPAVRVRRRKSHDAENERPQRSPSAQRGGQKFVEAGFPMPASKLSGSRV
jgi:hypothetical protein